MTRLRTLKTSFTAGEVSRELLGRGDLAAYENGAAKLRNVFIEPTGGVRRRAGLAYVDRAARNIAPYAGAVAATAPNGGTAASAADDNPATELVTTQALATSDPYVVVHYDLGAPATIAFADVRGLRAIGPELDGEFFIQHSTDNATWTSLGTAVDLRTEGRDRRRGSVAAPVTARYWRVARIGGTDRPSTTVGLADFTLWIEEAGLSELRFCSFEFSIEQAYLVVFSDQNIAIYREGLKQADLRSPYAGAQLSQLDWTQSQDTLIAVHPDVQPHKLVRQGAHDEWTIEPLTFTNAPGYAFDGATAGTLTVADPVPLDSGRTTTLTSTAADFAGTGPGWYVRGAGGRARIDSRVSDTQVTVTVVAQLSSATAAAGDWEVEEPAWSSARGWPQSVVFHQDRLVFGGSRDLPNRLWMSVSGDLYNFDLGEGLDDRAIEFAVLSDQVNAIRAVFSGRHLQVFTSGAEWMVTGDPLTPSNVQARRQTQVGSQIDRKVPPQDVDGATLFAARNGRELREFLFTDIEQAYQATDLGVLARHLINDPVDQAYDKDNRLFHIVMADGSLATVTVYRAEQVTAWTRQETQGSFLAVAVVAGTVYVAVERASGRLIERFDPSLTTDSARLLSAGAPTDQWSGFDHLEGQTVKVVGDGVVLPDTTVSGGVVTSTTPVSSMQAGLGFTHEIEPLPPAVRGPGGPNQGTPVRLIEATFRLLDTAALRLDVGRGLQDLPFRKLGPTGVLDAPLPPFTGDRKVRGFGWRRAGTDPLWRISQDAPLPCTLLSVTAEMKVND